jgi:hypothetical protein
MATKDLTLRGLLIRARPRADADREFYDSSLRGLPGLVKVGVLVPVLVVAYGYLRYASAAWFHLDDFLFINDYHDSIRFDQLLRPPGFGRFVSVNLYWNLAWRILGSEASFYFALNFFVIVATALLLGRLIAKHYGATAGLVSGFIYIALPNVISGYTWLSNSQHFLAHLFAALFLYVYFGSPQRQFNATTFVVLEIVLVVALLSNQLASGLVVVPVVDLLVNRESRRQRARWIFLGVVAVTVAAFYLRARNNYTGVYASDLTSSTVLTNARFYFGGTAKLFAAFLVVAFAGFAIAAWKRDALHATLFLGGMVFVSPFLILEYQRYDHYVSFGLAWFFIAIWLAIYKFLEVRTHAVVPVAALMVMLAMGAWGMNKLSDVLEQPVGADQHALITQMRNIVKADGPGVSHYCFTSTNLTDFPVGNTIKRIPSEWWGVGFGNAFYYFVDGSKTYDAQAFTTSCDRLVLIDRSSLREIPQQ